MLDLNQMLLQMLQAQQAAHGNEKRIGELLSQFIQTISTSVVELQKRVKELEDANAPKKELEPSS